MSLTASQIRAATPQTERYELFDREGLVLRVWPSGAKTWCVYYYDRGRKRRATVGGWPAVGIREARAERDRVKAEAVGRDAITFAAFAREYMATWASPRKRSAGTDQRILNKDVLPVLGDRPVVQITRRECSKVVDRVQARGAQDMAAKTHAVMRRVLQVAVERGVLEANPASRIVAPQSPPRKRVLSADELVAWWPCLITHGEGTGQLSRMALQLVLLTAQRLGEVLTIERRDIDLTHELWTIPAEKTKNGQAHTVPLSDPAMVIVRRTIEAPTGSQYLIPVSADKVRAMMRSTIEDADIARATPHDLRRTAATWLGRIGFDRTIQDKVLNHVDRSVGGIYDLYRYDAEKRAALDKWAEKLAEITATNRHPNSTPDLPETAAPCGAQPHRTVIRDDREIDPRGRNRGES